jgi:hypothetical protein
VVIAKLPEKDGVFEYHVRSASEQHERLARETELNAVVVEEKPPEAPRHGRENGRAKPDP